MPTKPKTGVAKKAATKPATSTKSSSSTRPRAKSTEGNGRQKPAGTRTRVNGSAGQPTVRAKAPAATTTKRRRNEQAPVMELAAQTVHDYGQAKKALGQLWEDVTNTTYSAFNTIAVKVEKRFDESRKAISEIDVRYALEKTGDKIKSVAKSTSATAQQLAKQVKLLYMMLKDSSAGKFKAPWVAVSAITAALLYFISPIDVLPDFIPGIGLIDDALVLSLCISIIRMDLRRYVKERGLDLAEYGLAKEKSRA